jgi:hypothetical protein
MTNAKRARRVAYLNSVSFSPVTKPESVLPSE